MASPAGGVAVIGGGIAGLAAAYELKCSGVKAVVLEAGDRPGGKIDSTPVGGLAVDSGPDGFVARDPAAADLCRRIGLGADLVTPTSSGAYVWVGGELLPIPDRSVLGVPWTADAVTGTGIVSEMGTDTLRRGLARDARPLAGDASVGEVLRPRVGDEAFERLVDPLLGGINAGSADQMSIEACAPPLYEAAARGGPLGPALQEVAARQGQDRGDPGTAAPVFQSVNGGVTRIVKTLAAELGEAVKLATPVLSVSPVANRGGGPRWKVTTPNGTLDTDGVILACPAWESARLLEPLAPDAAAILGEIEYSDVVLTAFAVQADRLARPLDGSGFLVPRSQGLLTTACSWASSKWRHYAHEGRAVLRVSAGRTDDRRWLELDSAELVSALAAELAETGLVSPRDAAQGRFEARVTPWRRSLPQYRPGHLERATAVEACLADGTPGLVAAGAAFRGLGLPACVRGAQAAAMTVARAVLC
ncbi:MAG: protoporphyrinogen oxidase [Acidimicrobiaceae bacterium]|nr:protoporphyrinogen oxidase [Acidimicrobiaceae bacterium]